MKINHWIVLIVGSVLTTIAVAKLPVPVLSDEQKAKAEEAKAKAADTAKKATADEQRYQDRVAERFFREAKATGKSPPASQWVPPAAAAPATAVGSATAPAAAGRAATPAPVVPAKKT